MNKKVLLYVLAGWLLAAVISPAHVLGMFGKKSG